jgi:hypothetical protein
MAFSAGPGSASCRTGGPGPALWPVFQAGPARRRRRPDGPRPGPALSICSGDARPAGAPATGREGGGGAGRGAHRGRGAGTGVAQVLAAMAAPDAAGSPWSCGGADWGSDHERGPRRSRHRPPREGSGGGGPTIPQPRITDDFGVGISRFSNLLSVVINLCRRTLSVVVSGVGISYSDGHNLRRRILRYQILYQRTLL